MDELANCPFCGSGPAKEPGRYTQASFSGVEAMTLGEGYHHVWCGTCGSQGSTQATAAEAIAAWNTRPPATMPDAEIVEMLAEAITDTLDMDWQPLWGATACLTALRNAGLIGDAK